VRSGTLTAGFVDAARGDHEGGRGGGEEPLRRAHLAAHGAPRRSQSPPAKPASVGKSRRRPADLRRSACAADTTTGVGLNIRSPSTDAKKLTTLPEGSSVTVIGKKGDWYEVKYGGKTAYMHGAYLKK
jgi:uncharacterized protein YgiM (DUF1202 family)